VFVDRPLLRTNLSLVVAVLLHIAGILLLSRPAARGESAADLQEVSFMDVTYRPEVARVLPKTAIPVGGGGWLRQFPYWYTRWGIKSLNKEGLPVLVYFHPWELEPRLPRVKLSLKNRIREYGNLNTMEIKVKKLLDDFDFMTIGEYISDLKNMEKA